MRKVEEEILNQEKPKRSTPEKKKKKGFSESVSGQILDRIFYLTVILVFIVGVDVGLNFFVNQVEEMQAIAEEHIENEFSDAEENLLDAMMSTESEFAIGSISETLTSLLNFHGGVNEINQRLLDGTITRDQLESSVRLPASDSYYSFYVTRVNDYLGMELYIQDDTGDYFIFNVEAIDLLPRVAMEKTQMLATYLHQMMQNLDASKDMLFSEVEQVELNKVTSLLDEYSSQLGLLANSFTDPSIDQQATIARAIEIEQELVPLFESLDITTQGLQARARKAATDSLSPLPVEVDVLIRVFSELLEILRGGLSLFALFSLVIFGASKTRQLEFYKDVVFRFQKRKGLNDGQENPDQDEEGSRIENEQRYREASQRVGDELTGVADSSSSYDDKLGSSTYNVTSS